MSLLAGADEIESVRIELAGIGRSIRSSFRSHLSSFRSVSDYDNACDEEHEQQWAALERLPTFERITAALFDGANGSGYGRNKNQRQVTDVTKLGAQERHMFIEKLIKNIESDNLRLLRKLRKRIDKVGIQLPRVEVRFENLCVEADCEVVHGKPLPTLWSATKGMLSASMDFLFSKRFTKISILKDVSGIIKPGRMTLLLGPPGCGKTTLLLALSGRLSSSLKVQGEVSYNGYRLDEFVPQKTSAYVSQSDLHVPEMTVRETLDFAACCQGTGSRAELMAEISRREKLEGIVPDPDIDAYMKATSVEGLKSNLQTDYILKILGLDVCADTMIGDAMRRGVSGGQKKRVTTGEMIVGPTRTLFMDEISNGLDSSTTFQIVLYLRQFVHINDATVLVSLLQPAPETFDLFDDVLLMAEGKIIYHGPRTHVCKFFEECGFRCPERKGVPDFLQEVISRKDQEQYWYRSDEPYSYVSTDQFIKKFIELDLGSKVDKVLLKADDNSKSHKEVALSFRRYTLTKWDMLKACSAREFLLMKRNSFVYVFKSSQLIIIASITMTAFLHTGSKIDALHGNYLMGSLFYALVIVLVDGYPELSMTLSRLSVFCKQKDLYFYPAWAYVIPAVILKLPLSLLESFVWTCLTYYVIGYSPEFGRFIRQFMIFFAVHVTSISMFRSIASICRTVATSMTVGSLCILLLLLFGGFVIRKSSMPAWLQWGFWVCPLTYGEIGLTTNEFLASRWGKVLSGNITVGQQVLEDRGLNFGSYNYWISLGVLSGFAVFFNVVFALALTFLKSPGKSRAMISYEKYTLAKGKETCYSNLDGDTQATVKASTGGEHCKERMVLPFEPLTLTFQEVRYLVDKPQEMRNKGFPQKRLQLLCDVTGALQPGILTALMGMSGAGKTTLLDVLSGRKTGGIIEGEIRIGGYLKVQETFSRVSGYCEQFDIHSPNVTVEESAIHSAWLRLPAHVDSKAKADIVNEVLETIELEDVRDSFVGVPGVSGLSNEQRKRLTIAVELVANPSIIFMDEPTSGLDARAAAVVMRAVKNVVKTGRTVVCTIHQPSIDIFEAFDELILMKPGGRIIYHGPLGRHSRQVIEYFQAIPGVPTIKENYNPATWMLEISSQSMENELGVDFAEVYRTSNLYTENKELVERLSLPAPGTKDLQFSTRFSQNMWEQFKACLWKQHLSYWRSPSYNLTRLLFVCISSFLFGLLFWKRAQKINNQQDLLNILGSMFTIVIFFGINNCSTVLPLVSMERTVLYRERFAGMYSPSAYAFAQVLIEVPYIFIQAVVYMIIVYPMIGYYGSARKIFWSLYCVFCSLLSFNYLGMMLVSLTPNIHTASILASSFYTMLNLFSGFIIPKPQIPRWWVWAYYLTPTSWALNGLLTSQYGDIHEEISAFGEAKAVSAFLKDYFGYSHEFLGVVALLLVFFPITFAALFAYFVGNINFQKR